MATINRMFMNKSFTGYYFCRLPMKGKRKYTESNDNLKYKYALNDAYHLRMTRQPRVL
jgi:hypothetical protein